MEPAESMYPKNTDKYHFKRSKNIWQAKHTRGTHIFVEASTYELAQEKVKLIFKLMNRNVELGSFQIRRLSIVDCAHPKIAIAGLYARCLICNVAWITDKQDLKGVVK